MYSPKPFAQEPSPENIAAYLQQELAAISREMSETQTVELRTLHAAPLKPREGMIVSADGTDWDPGSGKGSYSYQSGAWVFLGAQSQDLSGYLTKVDNLASVADAATALSNLAGAPLASPALTGNPTAPTQSPGTNNTRLATTAYADAAVAALVVTGRLVAGTPLVKNPYASSSTTTQAHGLGVVPAYIDWAWECLTANINFSVGDIVRQQGITNVCMALADATNVVFVASNSLPAFTNKTSFANSSTITAADWKLTLTPYQLV